MKQSPRYLSPTDTLGGDKALITVADTMKHALQKSYYNDDADAMTVGQPVYLKTNGKIAKALDGTVKPIGIIFKGGAAGEKCTVTLYGYAIVNAHIAAISNAGVELESSGTINGTTKQPVFLAASSGDYVVAILLQATTAINTVARVLMVPIYQKN